MVQIIRSEDFEFACGRIAHSLKNSSPVNVGEWQSQKIAEPFREMHDLILDIGIPMMIDDLQKAIKPNLPWAEDHFQERVGGIPLNPPPSAAWWPFAQQDHKDHTDRDHRFSHTYPERYWPKYAGTPNVRYANRGIRYAYGDLDDMVKLLNKSPFTRQAYLPVWFPEDTGAGQRVPCSLGYHFQIRKGLLNCTYLIRSCDFMRHFADDVYMTGRLMQWVADKTHTNTGRLVMHVMNLHAFASDDFRLSLMIKQWRDRMNDTRDGYCADD